MFPRLSAFVIALPAIGLSVPLADAAEVLVLSSGEESIDIAAVAALEDGGHVVTIGPEYAEFDGSGLSEVDGLLLLASLDLTSSDMPETGQTAIVDFVNDGGSLVTGEWVVWKHGAFGAFDILDAIIPVERTTGVTHGNVFITMTRSNADPVLHAGVEPKFTFFADNNFGTETFFRARPGATSMYFSSNLGDAVIGWNVGGGRVLSYSTVMGTEELGDPDYRVLLANSFDWLFVDCDGNGIADADDIAGSAELDQDGNGILDVCEPGVGDCNSNGRSDYYDINFDPSMSDCNENGLPDDCDLAPPFSQVDFDFDDAPPVVGSLACDDCTTGVVALPFDIVIGGNTFVSFTQGSEGWIELLRDGDVPTDFVFPLAEQLIDNAPDHTFVFAAFDDLSSEVAGGFTYGFGADSVVFTWETETFCDEGTGLVSRYNVTITADGVVRWDVIENAINCYDWGLYSGIYLGETEQLVKVFAGYLPEGTSWQAPGVPGSLDENGNGVPDECDSPEFVGPAGGSWFEPTNWSTGNLPDAGDDISLDVLVTVDQVGAEAASVTVADGGGVAFAGGTLAADVIVAAGGTLEGNGMITGAVSNGGSITPGQIIVDGTYAQDAAGRLVFEFVGPGSLASAAPFEVSGQADLAGAVEVILGGGEPAVGEMLVLMTAGSIASDFDFKSTPVFQADAFMDIEADGNSVVASVEELDNILAADAEIIHDGFAENDRLGNAVAGIGDVNDDGFSDYAIGAYLKTVGGQTQRGRVYLFSGADGSILWSQKGQAQGDQFGFAVAAAGDVNGNGTPDVIVGARRFDNGTKANAGKAYVYDGADGTPIWSYTGGGADDQLGSAVDGVGDITGDGLSEVIVGAPRKAGKKGRFYVLSGADASIVHFDTGAAADHRLGTSVAGVGDVDGDGTLDFAAGAPKAGSGVVRVYSGIDGAMLFELAAGADGDWFGNAVDGVGDLDGDDRSDLIVGSRFAGGTGAAYVFNADGVLVLTLGGQAANDEFGYDVAGIGDVDDDGSPDLAVGAPFHAGQGRGYLYSGDGTPLARLTSQNPSDVFGLSIDTAGDVDGDGSSDVISGARMYDGPSTNSGRGYVFLLSVTVPGDLNGDGVVDGADLGLLLGAWGPCDGCPADLNGDGNVDGADLGILLGAWN